MSTLVVVVLTGVAAHAQPAPAGPAVAPCTVLNPVYTISGKNVQAGTMFATKVGEREVLVTAHSVFGPGGGLPAQLSPDEVVAKVTAGTAKDALNPKTACARLGRARKVADAAADAGAARNLAVFDILREEGPNRLTAVAPVPLVVLPLAEKAPKVGDPVWLLAVVDGREGGKWPAEVVQSDAGSLYYRYADKTLPLAGTVGAAVVDASGAVVGMNVGGGTMPDDGSLIGSAAPIGTLKERLAAAVR